MNRLLTALGALPLLAGVLWPLNMNHGSHFAPAGLNSSELHLLAPTGVARELTISPKHEIVSLVMLVVAWLMRK